MSDVMDRLRAANPVTEEPVAPPVEPLLARLDPAPPPRRSRRWVLVPVFAAVLAAIVVGLDLRGPSVDVVAEARAALGSGGIVHIIAREEHFNYDGTLVQGSGTTSEIWSASDPLRFHVREATRHHSTWDAAYVDGVVTTRDSKDGKIQSTRLDEAERRATEDMDNHTGLTQPGRDPIPVIRRLLANGELEHAGSAELDGRKVERLVGSTPAGDDGTPREDVEYLVDAETYAPVRLATKGTLKDGRPAGSFKLTFKLYERLPLTAENEKLLVVQ